MRALEASRETGVQLIVGSEFQLDADRRGRPKLVLLAETSRGYTTPVPLDHRKAAAGRKGRIPVTPRRFRRRPADGLLVLWMPDARLRRTTAPGCASASTAACGSRSNCTAARTTTARLQALLALAHALGIPAVASGDVHMHVRGRRALQDTMTAIRLRTTLAEAGMRLFPNGERHLRTRRALAAIHPRQLLDEPLRIAARCTFSLERLNYEYPHELVPAGHTPTTWLRQLTEDGMRWRWPGGEPPPGPRADREGTRTDRGEAVRILFPHRA